MNSMLNRSEKDWDSSLKNSTGWRTFALADFTFNEFNISSLFIGHVLLPAPTAIVWNVANLRHAWEDQCQASRRTFPLYMISVTKLQLRRSYS